MKDLTKLKEAFASLKATFNEVITPQKFVSAKLVDGTEVESDGEMFEVGKPLSVISEGEKLQAPQGEHTLETGMILVVDEAGLISEIKEAEVEAKKEEPTEMEVLSAKVDSLQGQLSEVVSKLAMASEEAKKESDKNKELFKKINEVLELLAQEPQSPNPTPSVHTTLRADKDNNIKDVVSILSKLKQ